MTIENQCLNNCWGKLFKSEIIKNNKIRFDSQMKIGEDAKFVLKYLQESSSLKICNLPLQAYIINEEGAMRKAGLEALGDEIKTYEARINTLRNLQVEISDELMQVLNLTYYNKIIGYLIQDSHKFGVVKNYENICRYIENKKIKEILNKLPNKSLSFKQKLLLLFIKNRWYLLLAVMLKIFI